MMKPSQATVRQARLAAEYRQHANGRQYFRPVLITGQRVDFRFGGYIIRFVWESGRVLRIGTDSYPYLQPEDFALLHCEAQINMDAARNGYKDKNQKKPIRRTKSIPSAAQLQFNL